MSKSLKGTPLFQADKVTIIAKLNPMDAHRAESNFKSGIKSLYNVLHPTEEKETADNINESSNNTNPESVSSIIHKVVDYVLSIMSTLTKIADTVDEIYTSIKIIMDKLTPSSNG